MKLLILLRVVLLSLYWQLPKSRELGSMSHIKFERSLNHRKEKRKKLIKERGKIPVIERKLKTHQGFKTSKPKDARFADQRQLRRMFRGV